MQSGRRIRVAFANNYVTPYRAPLYETMAAFPDWDFMLFVSTLMEFDRQWGTRREWPFFCKVNYNLHYKRNLVHTVPFVYEDVRQVHLPVGLLFDLLKYKPDVVVSAELGMRSLISALYCRLAGKPLILWYYQTRWTERDISRQKKWVRRMLIPLAQAFVGMGKEARAYLQSLGISPSIIFDAPNAVDMARFNRRLPEWERRELRARFKADGLTFLFVGRMIPIKGISHLLQAWKRFSDSHPDEVTLLLVGGGVLEDSLRRQVEAMGLKNVIFPGFIQPEKIPEVYGAADISVFPTLEDNWGLVVNESMAMGVPVICSRYAGCATDLIVEGRNGWLVDPLDIGDMVRKLEAAWDAQERGTSMSRYAVDSIAEVTLDRMAEGFRSAVDFVVRRTRATREVV